MEQETTHTGRTETFRTTIQINASDLKINHKEAILCVGSCFAENMGERLMEHKFTTLCNPSGILFNPVSIADSLMMLLRPEAQSEPDPPFYRDGLWQSYQFHGSFSHPDKETCLQGMQKAVALGREFTQKTDWLILTLGSNVVYRLKENGKVVANCHKMPSSFFAKEALTFEEMIGPLADSLRLFKTLRPALHCIVTVSPVRYIRNNFEENSYSKANLRILAHQLCAMFDWVSYFPAFEIMQDDLRDYRFYAQDRIHPSTEAVDYIWHCFSDAFFSEGTRQINGEIAQLRKAIQHHPLFPQSDAFQQFRQQTIRQLEEWQRNYPYLDWKEEFARMTK